MHIEISVVIPAFNESENIRCTLTTVVAELKKITNSYEIIVIDDGSKDNTWNELAECSCVIKGLRAIRLTRNFGKEYALCAGLEQAHGAAIIIMDADLQHPPSLIPQMVKIWREQKADIVECIKRQTGQKKFINKMGAKLFYILLKKLSGFDLEKESDFKLLDWKVIKVWKQFPERNVFFRGLIAWFGFKSIKIDFEVPERIGGESRWSIRDLTRLAVNTMVGFSSLPLQIITVAGVIFLIAAVTIGTEALYNKIIGQANAGFTTVILLILIVGSIILISLGIIGKYVAAIYNEVKHRPRYIIEQFIEYSEQQHNINKPVTDINHDHHKRLRDQSVKFLIIILSFMLSFPEAISLSSFVS
jgi:glycosyltransferase involved in cell wall biosynthesis